MGNLESTINLTCMFLVCGRKPKELMQARGEHANSTQVCWIPESSCCEPTVLITTPLCCIQKKSNIIPNDLRVTLHLYSVSTSATIQISCYSENWFTQYHKNYSRQCINICRKKFQWYKLVPKKESY